MGAISRWREWIMIVHAGSCLGAVFSSDLIPSESDQTWMIGLEKFPPKFSQNKPDLIYGDIRCLINILELNLTTSPLFPPHYDRLLGGKPKRTSSLALTITSVSTPYVSMSLFFLLFFYYQGTRNTGDVGCPLGGTIPACRSRMYS